MIESDRNRYSLNASRRIPDATIESIERIDAVLERGIESNLGNESVIEKCFSKACSLETDSPGYWLLMVRLAEAALLCAGNYADNCEFKAAGDLLVNPREILVYRKSGGRPQVKNRHERLSDQLREEGDESRHWMKLFPSRFFLEVTKPPLLPLLTKILRESVRISPDYIQRLEEGQQRIAETLSFLNAWRISGPVDLWKRLRAISASEREFVESHLCRFDAREFHRIGASLRRCLSVPDARSPFLAEPNPTATSCKRAAFSVI